MSPWVCREVGKHIGDKGCVLRCYERLMMLPVTYKVTHTLDCECHSNPHFKTDAEYVTNYMSGIYNTCSGLVGKRVYPPEAIYALQWAIQALAFKFDAKIRQARFEGPEDGGGSGFRLPTNVPKPSFQHTALYYCLMGNDTPRVVIDNLLHTLASYAVPYSSDRKSETARRALPAVQVSRAPPPPEPIECKDDKISKQASVRLPTSLGKLPDDPAERAQFISTVTDQNPQSGAGAPVGDVLAMVACAS